MPLLTQRPTPIYRDTKERTIFTFRIPHLIDHILENVESNLLFRFGSTGQPNVSFKIFPLAFLNGLKIILEKRESTL